MVCVLHEEAVVKPIATANMARLGRWALLLATLLMVAALFFTVFWTVRGVGTATSLLLRGQAELLHDGVRARIVRPASPGDIPDLAPVLDSLEDEGLLYVAIVGPEGRVLAEAGKPGSLELEIAARGGEPVEIDGRARAVFRGWSGRRRQQALPGAGAAPMLPRPAVVIEFDPRAARELRTAARSTLAVGALAAGALLAVALFLVRWLQRRASVEAKLEHERRLASLGRMSATLAHEIRNPLASLKGNAQLLERALPVGEKPRAKAERVVEEAVRLETLVNDLLEFARSPELRRVDTDPASLLREVAVSLDAERVVIDSTRAPSRWRMDPERMRQVLANLVENALQASDGPAEVTVFAERGAGELTFVVRDRGPGIAPEDLERIFEPFFTKRTRGTGLGLAVARRFVELHGGTLAADNAPDGGAVFTVKIPR